MKLGRKIALATLVSLSVFFGTNHMRIYLTDNFNEVIAGELYRSAQMSQSKLEETIKDKGIKSIVNLRGRSDEDYNQDEIGQSMGVKFIEFPISAGRKLSVDDMHQLIALMRDAPKPLLIHCLAGADRTGLATTLYLEAIAGEDPAVAGVALSFAFGHYSIPYTNAYAMDESWSDHLAFKERQIATR